MEQRSTQPDSTQHRYQIGDRVRVRSVGMSVDGFVGTIGAVGSRSYRINADNGRTFPVRHDEVEPYNPAEDLIALAEQLGAVEHSSYVDAGLLCRRFITSDGSIDLTVRVK